jgi:hypothetical protein
VKTLTSHDSARLFVSTLEHRGAIWSWRPGPDREWWLDLNDVRGMTEADAATIAQAAFQIRDDIRAVLLERDALGSHAIH